jgi:hypothetical protein
MLRSGERAHDAECTYGTAACCSVCMHRKVMVVVVLLLTMSKSHESWS